MGAILNDLDGHEGYPLRQLRDVTRDRQHNPFHRVRARMRLRWTGTGRYEPTEAGYDAARSEWEHDHARPLLEHVIPDQVQHLLRDTLRTLDNLAAQRPHATAKALRHLDAWRTAIARRLDARLSAASHRHVDWCCCGNIRRPPSRRSLAMSRSKPAQGLTPSEWVLRARMAANISWAKTDDRSARTAPPIRRRWLASRNRSTRSAGPAPRSAIVEPSTPCGHMTGLALRSAQVRRRRPAS